MQQAGLLLEQAVDAIPGRLLQPLHAALWAMIARFDIPERQKGVLDFYAEHLQYKKSEQELSLSSIG